MKTLRAVFSGFTRSPLKLTLTLLTVGLGVGVLIFALSISTAFSRLFREQLEREGIVVMIANAKLSESTGQMEPVRPSQFDEKVLNILATDVQGVQAVSPVDTRGFNELVAGQATYRIRSVVAADAGYAGVMGLEPAVIGQTMRPPAPTTTTQSGQSGGTAPRGPVMSTFTVCGVFKDVGELKRTSYGVGDMIVPYTSLLPQGANIQMASRFAMSTIALRVKGSGLAVVESQVRAALARQYGEDVSVEVWEGTPRGETQTL
jgi:hypothetical protein